MVSKKVMNEKTRAFLGRRVRALRVERGLSQSTLAAQIGTPQPKLSRIELGKTDVQLSTIKKLADALGVPLKDLLPDC